MCVLIGSYLFLFFFCFFYNRFLHNFSWHIIKVRDWFFHWNSRRTCNFYEKVQWFSLYYRSELIGIYNDNNTNTSTNNKGEVHPNQNWVCFVYYLKIINTILKNDFSIVAGQAVLELIIILIINLTRISQFSAYTLAIFTEYTAWAAWGGGHVGGTCAPLPTYQHKLKFRRKKSRNADFFFYGPNLFLPF